MQQYDFPRRPDINLRISPRMIYLALGVILLIWVLSGIYQVDADQQAVVLRFGRSTGVTGPGIHYHLPAPIERVEIERVTEVKRIEIGFRSITMDPAPRYQKVTRESEMLTGDENIVDVEMIVQYRIRDIENYLFRLAGTNICLKFDRMSRRFLKVYIRCFNVESFEV